MYRLTNWGTVEIQIYRKFGHPGVKHMILGTKYEEYIEAKIK